MLALGLSGGIASGKSTACTLLIDLCPGAVLFDADRSVHGLLGRPDIAGRIESELGPGLLAADGSIDRQALRGRVFASASTGERKRLEAILHPLVREECLDTLSAACQSAAPLFVADIPLLFETGYDFGQQLRVLVAASRATRSRRLQARNGYDQATVDKILATQMPQEAKIPLADVVFWNEGPVSVLEAQLRRFLHSHALIPS